MKQLIGITMGDAAGIGAEIVVKALNHSALYDQAIPVVYGDRAAMEDALRFTGLSHLKLNVIEQCEQARGEYGTIFICSNQAAGPIKRIRPPRVRLPSSTSSVPFRTPWPGNSPRS